MRKMKIKFPFYLFVVLVLIGGAIKYAPQVISVSNAVNGRELPIYSVQTEKKQVALSFDAA
ncbi:hypothetical protein ACTQ6A_09425 [Lachnospiraceae bacterium LCP25S3_G4]